MRVEDFLKDTARRLPDKCALVADGVRMSYAELDAMSDRLAAFFVQEGIKPGDRIVIFPRSERDKDPKPRALSALGPGDAVPLSLEAVILPRSLIARIVL